MTERGEEKEREEKRKRERKREGKGEDERENITKAFRCSIQFITKIFFFFFLNFR